VKENNICKVKAIVTENPELINHTDFVFSCNQIGETPLHWASKRGFYLMVDLFLEMGANVYLRNIVRDIIRTTGLQRI
jgi:ankyrin repeat protein